MTNVIAPLDILARLRMKRIGLSIDDFGTGHSSLAQRAWLAIWEARQPGLIAASSAEPASTAHPVAGLRV